MALGAIARIARYFRTFIIEKEGDSFSVYDVPDSPLSENSVAAVYSAVNMLAESTSSLNKYVARKVGYDEPYYEAVEDHPLNTLLRFPSPYVEARLFWEMIARHLVATGNVHVWIRRSSNGRPVSLWPGSAELKYDGSEYEFVPWPLDGKPFQRLKLPINSVMGIHGPGFNGISAPSPIMHAALQTSSTMVRAQAYQLQRFKSGIYSQTVIETDPTLEGINFTALKKNAKLLSVLYNQARKDGKIPILLPGYKLSSVGSVSAADLQLVELLRWSVEDIARVWNYNPAMLGIVRAGRPVMKELAEWFVRWTLRPVVERIAGSCTFNLLTSADQDEGLEVLFDLDRARLGTFADLIQMLDLAVARAGLLTINEGRRRAGYPPIEGGDVLLIPKGSPSDPENPATGTDDPDDNESIEREENDDENDEIPGTVRQTRNK